MQKDLTGALSLLVLVIGLWSNGNGTPTFRVPLGERQLFIDDHGVGQIDSLKRTLHQAEKRGAVVRSADPGQTIQTRSAPVWDPQEKRFKLWMINVDNPFRVSRDGLHWAAGPEPNMRIMLAVLDPNDPDPARRFKAALLNEGFAVSPNGSSWTKLDVPGIPSSDEGNFSYDPKEGLFIHSVKRGGPFGRSVAIATSRDFKTWKDYGVVFHADELDQEVGRRRIEERLKNPVLQQTEYNTPEHYSVQIYNMGVFRYEGLYIGLPSIYHHTGKVPKDWPGFDKMNLSPNILELVRTYGDYTGFYNIQLACSRDLVKWERLGHRAPFIEASPLGAGAYDTQTIIGPSAPVVRGDELWFYYTGIKQYAFITSGGDPAYEDHTPDGGAICLAVLRRDGFMSLDAGQKHGSITTKPFELTGDRLSVNVALQKNGQLLAEVLEAGDNAPIATAAPIVVGQRRGEVKWERGELKNFQGRTVSLRFTLRNGQLFSYWLD